METQKVDGVKLKAAIQEFGSLGKAIEHLTSELRALGKKKDQLQNEITEGELILKKLQSEIKDVQGKYDYLNNEFLQLQEKVEQSRRKYDLFEGFVAMFATSPSVTKPFQAIAEFLKKLIDSKWELSKTATDLRTIFVRAVMGDYLKCFRCDTCGTKFIANKEPHYKNIENYYQCPACHSHSAVKEDDSFLKVLVSNEAVENVRRFEDFQKENDFLRPLKAFLNLPCEFCGQPVSEWTKQDVDRGINGRGWGHAQCWNTPSGQVCQAMKVVENKLISRNQEVS